MEYRLTDPQSDDIYKTVSDLSPGIGLTQIFYNRPLKSEGDKIEKNTYFLYCSLSFPCCFLFHSLLFETIYFQGIQQRLSAVLPLYLVLCSLGAVDWPEPFYPYTFDPQEKTSRYLFYP